MFLNGGEISANTGGVGLMNIDASGMASITGVTIQENIGGIYSAGEFELASTEFQSPTNGVSVDIAGAANATSCLFTGPGSFVQLNTPTAELCFTGVHPTFQSTPAANFDLLFDNSITIDLDATTAARCVDRSCIPIVSCP